MIKRLVVSFIFLMVLVATAILRAPTDPRPSDAERFTKVAANGASLSVWQGPWQCVADQQLGLYWEVKSDREDLHHGSWTYSWREDDIGDVGKGDCYEQLSQCDTQHLISAANQAQWCGLASWRLPTANELTSLFILEGQPGFAQLRTDYFPHIKNGDYWSAHSELSLIGTYEHLGKGALAINPFSLQHLKLPYRNAAFVMLVADQPVTKPDQDRLSSIVN